MSKITIVSVIGTLLANATKSLINKALLGAGIGLATTVGLNSFVDYYKTKTIAEFGQLGAVSGLLHLSGLDKAISIIIGAYMCVAYFTLATQGLKMVLSRR